MKVISGIDCGNSPKKELIRKLTIHFASYEVQKAMAYLDEDVCWTLVGDEPVVGKEKFCSALLAMSENKAKELSIHSIITHGKEAAVHGEMLMEDGNRFGFSDFYEFTNSKGTNVKAIVSYVVHINKK